MLPEPSRLLGPSTSSINIFSLRSRISSSARDSLSTTTNFCNRISKMASSLALKRLFSSNIITARSLRSLPTAAAASRGRFFNTNAVRDDDDENRELDFDRRSAGYAPRRRDDFFTDSLFPFLAPTSLSQVLNLVDQMTLRPSLSNRRRGWDAKETDDALYLRVDMPGLGKEDVKISVEQNTLVIKGEGDKELNEEEDEAVNRYSSRIELPDMVFKTDEIKAEMKNGVLKVVLPKMKEDERKDVFHVKVE